MANKEQIEEMLDMFSGVIQDRHITRATLDGYFEALKIYTYESLKKAAFKCVEELKFFPKVPDIKARIPVGNNMDSSEFELKEWVICKACGHQGTGIKEPLTSKGYRCRECYTGITVTEHKEKMQHVIATMTYKQKKPIGLEDL